MEVYNNHLLSILYQLEDSELVKTKTATETNIADFFRILNNAVPVNDFERNVSDIIRFFYKQSRPAFFRFIHSSNMPQFILLTDGLPIINILNIHSVIGIRWNQAQNEFVLGEIDRTGRREFNDRREFTERRETQQNEPPGRHYQFGSGLRQPPPRVFTPHVESTDSGNDNEPRIMKNKEKKGKQSKYGPRTKEQKMAKYDKATRDAIKAEKRDAKRAAQGLPPLPAKKEKLPPISSENYANILANVRKDDGNPTSTATD